MRKPVVTVCTLDEGVRAAQLHCTLRIVGSTPSRPAVTPLPLVYRSSSCGRVAAAPIQEVNTQSPTPSAKRNLHLGRLQEGVGAHCVAPLRAFAHVLMPWLLLSCCSPSSRGERAHNILNLKVRSGPAAKRHGHAPAASLYAGGGTATRTGRLRIPRSEHEVRSTLHVHSSDTIHMYTVSVRAKHTIPHRPIMPICGEPATSTAPISPPSQGLN